jgi:hypothetical protein
MRNSRPEISQSLLGTRIAPVAFLTQITSSHADATTLLGAVRMAGSSELPEAYAENIIGLGR